MPSEQDARAWLERLVEQGPTAEVLAQAAQLDDAEGPEAPRFRYARAIALESAGRAADALPLLRSTIALAEDDPRLAARARVLLSDLFVQTGDSASGVALGAELLAAMASEVLDLPTRVAAGLCAARRMVGRAGPDAVHALLDAIAELSPDEPELVEMRAVAHAAEGDVFGAEAMIAAAQGPEASLSRLRLAQLAHRRGDNGAAIRWCHEVLASGPEPELRDAAWLCLGMASWHGGRYADAERAFSAVVSASDASGVDRETARTNLALLAMTQGRGLSPEEEAFVFAPEREELPYADVLYAARGTFLLFVREEPARAIEAFESALACIDRDADPDHAVEVLALRALALAALSRVEPSERSFAEAAALLPAASPSARARLSQLRGFARGLHADEPSSIAQAERDLAEAEEGFAAAGRGEVVAALRLRRATAAAARGDLPGCVALLDAAGEAAEDDPVEASLTCAGEAFRHGHVEVVVALCARALAREPNRAQRDRARLQRCVALASIDGAQALAEADEHLRDAGDSRENRQLRVNRVGMLIDAGRAVSQAEREFLLDDGRLEDALWPDVVRTIRATLWQDMAMPERAEAELSLAAASSTEGRRLAALQHVLFAYGCADANRLDAAREALRRGLAQAEEVPPPLRGGILMLGGSLQTTLEGPARGRDTLARCLREHAARGVENTTTRVARIHLALACALAGDPELDRVRAELLASLAEIDTDALRALALRTLGIMDGDAGRLVESADCFERVGDPVSAAGALDLACLIERDGAALRALLGRALALGEQRRATMRDGRDRASLRRASGDRAERLAVLCALDGDADAAARAVLSLHGEAPVDIDAVIASIEPGTLALEYALGAEALTVVAIADGEMSLRRAPWTPEDAAALTLVDGLGVLLAGHVSRSDLLALERALDALSSRLIAPIADLLADRRAVLVAPGLEFGAVPFAALDFGDGGPSLCARGLRSTRLLSLGQAPALAARHTRSRDALVLRGDDQLAGGPELPAADAEVTKVAALLSSAGWNLRPARAWSRAALEEVGWIHYAGHIRRAHDGDARLFVAGERVGGDALRGWTLANAPVVVLSGCESGVARGPDSDAHEGLVRPLFVAGARAVLSSLWPVSDERTLREMERFYAALALHPPAQALAIAARETHEESLRAGVPEVLARMHAANFHLYALR